MSNSHSSDARHTHSCSASRTLLPSAAPTSPTRPSNASCLAPSIPPNVIALVGGGAVEGADAEDGMEEEAGAEDVEEAAEDAEDAEEEEAEDAEDAEEEEEAAEEEAAGAPDKGAAEEDEAEDEEGNSAADAAPPYGVGTPGARAPFCGSPRYAVSCTSPRDSRHDKIPSTSWRAARRGTPDWPPHSPRSWARDRMLRCVWGALSRASFVSARRSSRDAITAEGGGLNPPLRFCVVRVVRVLEFSQPFVKPVVLRTPTRDTTASVSFKRCKLERVG